MVVLGINSRAACFSHFHPRHCEINFFERRRRQRGPDCHSAAVSAAVRQQLRSSSAAALHYLRSCSAAVLHYLRSCSSAPPQLRDTTTGRFFFLPSPVEKEKPTTARGRHGQFSASIGIGGCRREARALSVVPPSRRPLRSNNRRQQRRRRRRSCFLRARRGGGGVLSWISQLTRTDPSHYLSWRM